jgi:hypothetical protein
MRLRRVAPVVLSCVLLGLGFVSGLSQAQKIKAKSDEIKAAGCVRQGVEAGCLVLKDFKDKKLYSLHFPSGKKPDLDTAISFEGTKQDVDTCMQGIPVAVSKWTQLKMKCPPEKQTSATTNKSSKPMNKKIEGTCSDWKVWHDHQPGHPATLHVTGKCIFNTGGYSVELRPAVPQGINPAIYILNRIVHKAPGPVPQVLTEVPVHYVEKTSAQYTDVQIEPDGVTVPVKEVH